MKINSAKTPNILRIFARVMSAIMVAFALIMFIGEAMESAKRGTSEPLTTEAMIGLTLAGIGLLGLALAWKWEMAGGIICVVAFIVLFILNADASLWPMFIFPADGILFIVAAYLSKGENKNRVEEIKT